MSKNILIFLILSLFISVNLSALDSKLNDLKVIYPNNSTKLFKSLALNSKDYVSLDDLGHLLFPDSTFEISNNVIYGLNSSIKTAIGSMFIVIEFDKEMRIIQLNLPVIEFDGKTQVPYKSFFLSSNEIGVIKSKQSINLIELQSSRVSILKKQEIIEIPNKIEPQKSIAKEKEVKEKTHKLPIPDNKIVHPKTETIKKSTHQEAKIEHDIKSEKHVLKDEIPELNKLDHDIILKFDTANYKRKPNTYEIPQNLIRKNIKR